MLAHQLQITAWVILLLAALGLWESELADPSPQASGPRIEAALQNVMTLERPGHDGFATIWDGNKYEQRACKRRYGLASKRMSARPFSESGKACRSDGRSVEMRSVTMRTRVSYVSLESSSRRGVFAVLAVAANRLVTPFLPPIVELSPRSAARVRLRGTRSM